MGRPIEGHLTDAARIDSRGPGDLEPAPQLEQKLERAVPRLQGAAGAIANSDAFRMLIPATTADRVSPCSDRTAHGHRG